MLKRWKSARAFQQAHGGAEYRAKQALVSHFGRRVLAGPFAGLQYGNDVVCGAYVAKLVGSYEEELHGVIEQIKVRQYRRIVDVGCAEGYYAVGLAVQMPGARVLAYDIDENARRYCADLARLNGVAGRVEVRGRCGHAKLEASCGPETLVVCDCEGFEHELLDPAAVPRLKQTDLLVELHDCLRPGLTPDLLARFAHTHDVQLIESRERAVQDYPVLEVMRAEDRPWAVREGRGAVMQWAYFTARGVGQSSVAAA